MIAQVMAAALSRALSADLRSRNAIESYAVRSVRSAGPEPH